MVVHPQYVVGKNKNQQLLQSPPSEYNIATFVYTYYELLHTYD